MSELDTCPGCGSGEPFGRLLVGADNDEVQYCRNSWHPAQAFPVPEEAKHMTKTCGSHCGVKDNMSGHCDCSACHNGRRATEGLTPLSSTIGLSESIRRDRQA